MSRVRYQVGADVPRKADGSWFRGEHCHFIPSQKNLSEHDAIDQYIVKGWTPEAPFITHEHAILAFGSCFAQEVKKRLRHSGYRVLGRVANEQVPVVRQAAGINNTFAIRQQLEWAFEGKSPNEPLWWDQNRRQVEARESDRTRTREIFEQTDVFIITLGLSEVWHNKQTGEVFWRAIPRHHYDPEVHGFKVSTVTENLENLRVTQRLIRTHNPDAHIIFTLSPVPLVATFRPVSCVTANSVSKAILRVAVDELLRTTEDDHLHYWPSYEIVKDFFREPYQEDNRHVKREVVDTIMDRFDRYYLASRSH